MALKGLLSFCVLVLLKLQANQAYGATRVHRAWTRQETGICDSMVTNRGYKCEENYVTTRDGYILNMQRISSGGHDTEKQPVLLQHGILVDGMSWVINQPEQNLPFILADNGFDVWISNSRGTRFSRQHVFLNTRKKEYWDWSWDELAAYDLPAFIGFVYNETGQRVDYIGHSLGTLTILASLSDGLVADKVKSTVLLSPIAYLSNIKTVIASAAAKQFIGELGSIIGMEEFNLNKKSVKMYMKAVCSRPGVNCLDYARAITGKNCCLNASTIDIVIQHEPQSTSMKNLVHLAQLIRDKVIEKYDGTRLYNMKNYKAARSPLYDMSGIPRDHPLFLSHGGNDALSTVEDVKHLVDTLKKSHNADKLKVQFVENYGHADFVMAVNAKDVVYNQVVSFLKAQH